MEKPIETSKTKAVKEETESLLTGDAQVKKIIFQEEDKPYQYERKKLAISGILDTPARYLEKRTAIPAGEPGHLNILASHLIVNRENMSLKLTVHEEDHFMHLIGGQLEYHPDFIKFKINTGEAWDAFQFGDFVRMNRTFFDTIDYAVDLTTRLKSFKAKVDTEREKVQKQNGDFRTVFDQVVTSNLPSGFNLNIPIFKGYEAQKFVVEVHVRPADLAIILLSPEAKDQQTTLKDNAINDQLKAIKTTAPDLLITEE
jgi:hypothetical protein